MTPPVYQWQSGDSAAGIGGTDKEVHLYDFRTHVSQMASDPSRARRLRRCLVIGLVATALGGLPRWNPSTDIETVYRGIPANWIRTREPGALDITVGSVTVEVPEVREDGDHRPAGQFEVPIVLDPVRLMVDIAFWSVVTFAALTRPRRLARSLLVGLGLTAALAAIPYEFCSDGNGFGLPLAIVHPHLSSMPALGIPLPVNAMQDWVFDLLNLARDWLLWTVLAFGAAALRGRLRRILRRRNAQVLVQKWKRGEISWRPRAR